MKPQDILIILKLLLSEESEWSQPGLAKALHISASEVNHGLKRLAKAKLYNPVSKKCLRRSLAEFLIHGLKYAFPVEPGSLRRGIPTAHCAPPLSEALVYDPSDCYVWEDKSGAVKGQTIEPLYPSAPLAAKEDAELHELLALIDALRVGRAREVKLAREALSERILDS